MIKQKITDFTMNYGKYKELKCQAPCSMYSVLLDHKLIDDPFLRDNEKQLTSLSDTPCSFTAHFDADSLICERKRVTLRFYGLDTLCSITLNGVLIGEVDNMHRTYDFDIKSVIKHGENVLRLDFDPPHQYVDRLQNVHPLKTDVNCHPGVPHLRKAYFMSGWDWAPTLPDMGIFRDIEIIAYDHKIIDGIVVKQTHSENKVLLDLTLNTIGEDEMSRAVATLVSPGGKIYYCGFANGKSSITVSDPNLWWPNGLGQQNLYKLTVSLYSESELEDTREIRIGLRTLTVSRENDEIGQEFALQVNGVKFFSMGANYVPEDSILSRYTEQRTRTLLTDCKAANFNTVRVWGGAFYPPDYFYDLCDELGLLVWQDFMVACCHIWLNDEMKANMTAEFKDNFSRIAHHPSLGVIAGNNEIEWFTADDAEWKGEEVERDYLELYEHLLPSLAAEYAPETFYWQASPSSGGGFDNPNDDKRGDCHYWDPWSHGVPFESCRDYKFRFCSEFGFESLPNIKTVKSFATAEEDLNLYSEVMEAHQKKPFGTRLIVNHASGKYRYANSFEDFIYVSQLMQLDAMRYTVEHMRRYRGICMGSLYWQVNDCWPVSSWSSIDYHGRWKALHYGAKRFYAPVLVSAHEDGLTVSFSVSNEQRSDFEGKFYYAVMDNKNRLIFRDSFPISVEAMTAKDVLTSDFSSIMKGHEREYYIVYSVSGGAMSKGTLMFVPPKYFKFEKPSITTKITGEGTDFVLIISSDVYVKNVEIDFASVDAVFDDNYFDITDTAPIRIPFKTKTPSDAVSLKEHIHLRSVYDVGR